jgi:hypothetical protein
MTKQDAPPICRATEPDDKNAECLRDKPPETDAITDYDEAHFALYLELLHAEGHGSTVEQMAKEAFGLDPFSEPARSASIVNSHLQRAHWLCKAGARHFSR